MPFQLQSSDTPNVCPACGATVKKMAQHRGTAKCKIAAQRALIDRQGWVEIWYREKVMLTQAGRPVTVVRDQRKEKNQRRWYTTPEWQRAVRTLSGALQITEKSTGPAEFYATSPDEKRIVALLRGPTETLEAELAVIALAGPK